MNYSQSIRQINLWQLEYFRLCDLGETDDAIGKALDRLHQLKAAHKAQFGSLTRSNGLWI
jgi:hypothetical protein